MVGPSPFFSFLPLRTTQEAAGFGKLYFSSDIRFFGSPCLPGLLCPREPPPGAVPSHPSPLQATVLRAEWHQELQRFFGGCGSLEVPAVAASCCCQRLLLFSPQPWFSLGDHTWTTKLPLYFLICARHLDQDRLCSPSLPSFLWALVHGQSLTEGRIKASYGYGSRTSQP